MKKMNGAKIKKIIIAEHYGFCMGVKRAIATTKKTMIENEKVTILNEIVHNDAIVRKFSEAGVGQSKTITDINEGVVIISAHGASPEIFNKACEQGLKVIDATCPLVIHIHKIIKKLADNGYGILHFGDPEHDETIGIVGHAPKRVTVVQDAESLDKLKIDDEKIAVTAQSTARKSDFTEFVSHVKRKFPGAEVFNTICNATSQRQMAVTNLAPDVDMMLIVGSTTSANSKRLAQISKTICKRSHLINSGNDIKPEWFVGQDREIEIVGLSAGASTPDFLIDGAIDRLKVMSNFNVEVVYPEKSLSDNRLEIQRQRGNNIS
jgi:4-hydroxy-3-methylbut-2-enyl diphosphate reductase